MNRNTVFLIPLTSIDSFKAFVINMIRFSLMALKLITSGFLKILYTEEKGYDAVVFVYDVTKQFVM